MTTANFHTTKLQRNVPAKARPLTVYIKPSDYCNVGCDHCYLPKEVRANKYRMSESTFESSIQTIKDMAKNQNAPGVLIVWHGGEPLSLPVDYFESLASKLQKEIPEAVQSLQTSLIPYSQRWENLIKNHFESEIGSSIDFTQRTLRGSAEEYQDFWMKKVTKARENGFKIIPGIVPSISEIGRGKEIVEWMENRGFRQWNIDRYNQYSEFDPARPLNKAHSQFLSEVFLEVMEYAKKGIFISVNTIKASLGGVLFNQPGDRWGGHCSHDFLVINPDGSTNACPDKISFESFSNIKDGYKGYKDSEQRKAWIRLHLMGHRNSDCPTCPFNTFCKSGCPLTPNDVEAEGECSGYNKYLKTVLEFTQKNQKLTIDYLEATQ
jgi:radical SAM protein with 4Fe4S-binding SPASM domain